MAHDTLLTYSDFNVTFKIRADTSVFQLGAVISHKEKPIALYSRKLVDAKKRYTVTEREKIIKIETINEFRTILLGRKLRIYTIHENLTCDFFNTDRVLRGRQILEYYGIYI